MLIYQNMASRNIILTRALVHLRRQGLLILGATENLIGLEPALNAQLTPRHIEGAIVYQKTAAAHPHRIVNRSYGRRSLFHKTSAMAMSRF